METARMSKISLRVFKKGPFPYEVPIDRFFQSGMRAFRFSWMSKLYIYFQEILVNILHRMGAKISLMEEKVEYQKIEFDKNDLAKICHDQIKTVFLSTHQHPKYLLVGHEEYLELTKLRDHSGLYAVNIHDFYRQMDDKQQITVFGMKVVVVPWMDGILALPDLDEIQ